MADNNTKLRHANLIYIIDLYSKIVQSWRSHKDNVTTEPSNYGVSNISKEEFHESILSVELFLKSDEADLLFNPIASSTYIRNNHYQSITNAILGNLSALSSNPGIWPSLADSYFNFLNALSLTFFASPKLSLESPFSKELQIKAVQINDTLKKVELLLVYCDSAKKEIEALKISIDEVNSQTGIIHDSISRELESLELYKQGLNQKAFAGAFTSQADKLNGSLDRWFFVFIISILIISSVSLFPYISKNLTKFKEENNQNLNSQFTKTSDNSKELLFEMLMKITMSSPMIWLAWFSARQYSLTKKLQDEYKFKSAAATAYYGYSKEVSHNVELKNLLLEGAIKNFNENPSQSIENYNHKLSPMEEIILELIRKADPSTLETIFSKVKNSGK